MLELLFSGGFAQALEMASILLDQLERRALLNDTALVHHQNLVAGHDGLQISSDLESGTG
jgi:hypothetical protein